jgi:N-acetylglucosamine kinase-like BadF-type ATPase
VSAFLGIDGGGSKTAFLLIDDSGRVLGSHKEGPAYYLEIGLDALRSMLARGIEVTLAQAGMRAAAVEFSFLGLPSYGEDSQLVATLDGIASPQLPVGRYRCGNDAVCGWAGALAGEDGINLICGTGSMAYGEYRGRSARAGGWGELFSDEGSAYWLAREGLNLFSRMSDGRAARGPFYDLVRRHFKLAIDLDLCGAIYGKEQFQRSHLAALAPLVTEAAAAGDTAAAALLECAADELVELIAAVRSSLQIPDELTTKVSHSGGMFRQRELLLSRLQYRLEREGKRYALVEPKLSPTAGAALYAMRLAGRALDASAVKLLSAQSGQGSVRGAER